MSSNELINSLCSDNVQHSNSKHSDTVLPGQIFVPCEATLGEESLAHEAMLQKAPVLQNQPILDDDELMIISERDFTSRPAKKHKTSRITSTQSALGGMQNRARRPSYFQTWNGYSGAIQNTSGNTAPWKQVPESAPYFTASSQHSTGSTPVAWNISWADLKHRISSASEVVIDARRKITAAEHKIIQSLEKRATDYNKLFGQAILALGEEEDTAMVMARVRMAKDAEAEMYDDVLRALDKFRNIVVESKKTALSGFLSEVPEELQARRMAQEPSDNPYQPMRKERDVDQDDEEVFEPSANAIKLERLAEEQARSTTSGYDVGVAIKLEDLDEHTATGGEEMADAVVVTEGDAAANAREVCTALRAMTDREATTASETSGHQGDNVARESMLVDVEQIVSGEASALDAVIVGANSRNDRMAQSSAQFQAVLLPNKRCLMETVRLRAWYEAFLWQIIGSEDL